MRGELGGTGCCGGSNSSVAVAASARHPDLSPSAASDVIRLIDLDAQNRR